MVFTAKRCALKPPKNRLEAVKMLLEIHKNRVAMYRPRKGGLVLIADDADIEHAVISLLAEIGNLEMQSSDLEPTSPFLSADSVIPEA